jgi:hypothetical protein
MSVGFVPTERMALLCGWYRMERVDQGHYGERYTMHAALHEGLCNLFPACHEPVPSEMEDLLHQLQDEEPISARRQRST